MEHQGIENKLSDAGRLKRIRDLLGLSQREMAQELGVVHGAIGLWESGQRGIPGPVLVLMGMYEKELGCGPQTGGDAQETLSKLESSWFKRSVKLSSLSARFAATFIWNHLKGVLHKTTPREDIQSKTHRALSLKIADTFGRLKGLPMKLGQMVSYMNFHAPDLKGPSFAELQHWSPPMEAASVAEVLIREFMQTPSQLFKKWSPQPFAAASIGQVHRAELPDGTPVAVKIQYPDIRKLIQSDLATAALIDQLGSTLFSGQEPGLWISELRERLLEECDYQNERRNLQAFRLIYQNHPRIRIPEVFESHSSARVITTKLILGESFESWNAQAPQEERDKAGETILEFALGSLFRHGIFNGDPHPGNYLFGEEGVTFLDFGCVKRVRPEFTRLWLKFIKALVDDDRQKSKEAVIEFNVVPTPDRFDFDYHHDAMGEWYRPFIKREPFRFHPDFMTQCWRRLVEQNPNLRVMNVPKEWILVNHMNWGLYAILSHLKAQSHWHRTFDGLI